MWFVWVGTKVEDFLVVATAIRCNECEVLMDCAKKRTNLLAVTSKSEAKIEVEVEVESLVGGVTCWRKGERRQPDRPSGGAARSRRRVKFGDDNQVSTLQKPFDGTHSGKGGHF
jgi:hypothetical protein